VAGVVLETYKGRGIADALIQKAHDQAMNELTAASDNEGRELAQYLVNILK
jgi:ribosomal protein S18 acetylase RimI-like enzyme